MEDMTTADGPGRDAPVSVEEEALLGRSARLLASEDPEGFIDVSARVRSTVRATTRRSRPVHAVFPDAAGTVVPQEDTLVVRDWVVVGELREAVGALDGVTPTQITVTLDGDVCTGAAVHVTATFGAVLAEAATRVRRTVLDTLEDLLGPAAFDASAAPVDVTVDDVLP